MGKQIILVILLLIFSLGIVSAQPPWQQPSQQSPTEAGYLIIETGWGQYHKLGEDFYIHTHVYNGTNGLLLKDGVSCYYHTYNHQLKGGEHIDIGVLSQYGDGYYNYTDGSLFNITGDYSVLIWCNSTEEGGFTKFTFEVTYTGKDLSTSQSILYSFLLTLLILIFLSCFVGMNFLPARNETDEEGNLLSISYLKYFRNVLGMVAYFLFIGINYIASSLAYAFLGEELVADTLFMIFQVSFGLAPVVIIVWMIWIFVSMFHDKQFQQMLNRGIFPQGKI